MNLIRVMIAENVIGNIMTLKKESRRMTIMKKWVSLLLAAMMLLGVFSAAMADEKIVLKAACWDLEKTPYYNAIKSGFEAAYPDVTLEWVDLASQDYNIKATTMLSGGEAIDLMAVKELSDMLNI